MSVIPVLTKNQINKTLSAKKKKSKDTVRNVLASPYSKYWPLIAESDTQQLHDVLSKHLPRILQPRVKIPWIHLKGVPKEERKLARENFIKNQSVQLIEDESANSTSDREGLIFGVNDTTKGIEKQQVISLLITQDVQPKLMVEHLIDQCVLFRIPVLIVPKLREILKSVCGLTSIVIAFTNIEKYKAIQSTIGNIFTKYPVPRNHINFKRSLDLLDSSIICIDDNQNTDFNNKGQVEDDTNRKITNSDSQFICLYRTSKNCRVFTPSYDSEKLKVTKKMHRIIEGPSEGCDSMEDYQPLKVKRIKGNINRNKRKLDQIKGKKKPKQKKKNET